MTPDDLQEKRYSAIFFTWAGAAIPTAHCAALPPLAAMRALLRQGVHLIVLARQDYADLLGGRLHTYFDRHELEKLFVSTAHGAVHRGFDAAGDPAVLYARRPTLRDMLRLHELAFALHSQLLWHHRRGSRLLLDDPDCCALDLLSEQLRRQVQEPGALLHALEEELVQCAYTGGAEALLHRALDTARQMDLPLRAAITAGRLEMSYTDYGDSVEFYLRQVLRPRGIRAWQCCFLGSDFFCPGSAVCGADAAMLTSASCEGDFYDLSPTPGPLPAQVKHIGGGTAGFAAFLAAQARAEPGL